MWRLSRLLAGAFFCSYFSFFGAYAVAEIPLSQKVVRQGGGPQSYRWSRFAMPGNCSVNFPMKPQHVQQVTPLAGGQLEMRCDIYAAPSDKRAVYMMLIAQYPVEMGKMHEKLSLEGILNGLMKQNPTGQLKFADIVTINGYKALDFFIAAEGIYFKGRVLVTESNLYFLAMKCDEKNYSKEHYRQFIQSFQLSHDQ